MTLHLIREFIAAVDAENISYCHWKSNAAMERTLAGINDLDLLVATKDLEKFLEILTRLKFIRALSPVEGWFPPISNYYGYDGSSGRIVHLHLHDQLILGYDLIKNYHLPMEQEFLASAMETPAGQLKTPACEMEFIIFVLRMVLKRRLTTLIFGSGRQLGKVILGLGREGLGESARNELEFLRTRADSDKINDNLQRYFPVISPELFTECLLSIVPDAPRQAWLAAGRHLTRALKPYRRHSPLATAALVTRRGVGIKLNSLWMRFGWRQRPRKRLTPNGKIIAFVGGDGAGKTTNIASLSQWFKGHFEVATIHLGKPPKGVLWYVLGGLLKARKLLTGKTRDNLHQSLKLCLIARYRCRAFQHALKLRSEGVVVCLDRLPIPGMQSMDNPRIRDLTGGRGLYGRLARWEETWYARIRGVDELIVLRLDPKIASIRRPEDDPWTLASRSGEIWEKQWPAGFAHLVDAARPLAEVEKEIRHLAWASLRKQPRIIELIGPAGAGKSSTADNLFASSCDLQTYVPWRSHRFICLKVVVRRLPLLLKSFGRLYPAVKTLLGCEISLMVLQQHRQKQLLPCRNLVLDAGPISTLAFLQSHNLVDAQEWLAELQKIMAQTIDAVVWLDAPDDILKRRMDSRSKPHPLKFSDPSRIEEFFQSYRRSFAGLVSPAMVGFPVRLVDTEHSSVLQVTAMISDLLQGGSDGKG